MKRYLPFIIVVAVALLAVGSGAMLYRAKRPATLTMSGKGGEPKHVRGNPKASVTLEEFGDFQCPPCGRIAPEIKKLEEEGDALYSGAVGALFEGTPNPMEVIKWKELYDNIEHAIDECEDVLNVLESVSIKNS